MIDSPLRIRGGDKRVHSTPNKERPIIFSPTAFGNEENQENKSSAHRLSNKRSKLNIMSTPSKMSPLSIEKHAEQPNSDCGTETSSTVSARREWLKQFGKKHENPFSNLQSKRSHPSALDFSSPTPLPSTSKAPKESESSQPRMRTTPLKAACTTASAASALVDRIVSDPAKKNVKITIKPKFKKTEIQATNDGYASVAKLSEWLANDPTSVKQKRHVRRGRNVISKSRKFEKDMENVIVVESQITRGAVSDKKKWLQEAFHNEEDEDDDLGQVRSSHMVSRKAKSEAGGYDAASLISVSNKKDWLKKAFKKATEDSTDNEMSDACNRSEIVTDDAASSLSVSDKKDWLKNAFKKPQGTRTPVKSPYSSKSKSPYSKAKSDIVHCRGRDEVAARAKKRFLQRSRHATPSKAGFETPTKAPMPSTIEKTLLKSCEQKVAQVRFVDEPSTPKQQKEEQSMDREVRTGPPSSLNEEFKEINEGSNVEPHQEELGSFVEPETAVEEDQTPVDFRAARQALIQRSRSNGHKMQVINKVYMKKEKFEKLEKAARRRSGAFGLLKPSWEEADPTTGRPSDAYDKKFIQDIAPKKSFEELP